MSLHFTIQCESEPRRPFAPLPLCVKPASLRGWIRLDPGMLGALIETMETKSKAVKHDVIRTCRFNPYSGGGGWGPSFGLTLWDTGRRDWRGQSVLGYRLTMRSPGMSSFDVLFEGEDFAGSPLHGDDSDETVMSLMTFLTLRPGDTDAEYFAKYTPMQMDFATHYAETLSCYVVNRFEKGENS